MLPSSRQPSPQALAGERAILLGLYLDYSILVAMFTGAIWGNSLALLGDAIRGLLINLLEVVLLVILRRINRGQMTGYDYGTSKLEQFANLVVGAALILAGLWLAYGVLARWGAPQEQMQAGLWLAAGSSLVNLGINSWVFLALWRAGRDGKSIIVNGQIVARLTKVLASICVTAAVGLNALAGPGTFGAWADLAGTAVVVAVMLIFGGQMVAGALPHLIDRALGEMHQAAINRALAGRFPEYDELLSVRTRTEGSDAWIEVELGFAPERPIGEVSALADELAAEVRLLVPDAHVLVVPRAARPAPQA